MNIGPWPTFPYVRPPAAPRVAIVEPRRWTVVDERGVGWAIGTTPPDTRVYASHETVRDLLEYRGGEALCWNGQPIRYRLEARDDNWPPDPTDVLCIRTVWPSDGLEALMGLARWRDALEAEGAAPTSTVSSASWSLLRATLTAPLWTGVGDLPPIRWVSGGRQEPGRGGSHVGSFVHWDLPAAYASTLGNLRYGGHWRKIGSIELARSMHSHGRVAFGRARVRVPAMEYGPLPRRPRHRPGPNESAIMGQLFPTETFPTGTTLRGCWSFDELMAAEAAGCGVKITDAWVHAAPAGEAGQPFLPWWGAVQRLRRLPGFAGVLGKMTGNALWGRFAISASERSIVRVSKGRRKDRIAPSPGSGRRADPAMAEAIVGSVRAALYADILHPEAARVVVAHTDGAWLEAADKAWSGWPGPAWRAKDTAERIDVLDAQHLRHFRPGDPEPVYTMAGTDRDQAELAFEEAWSRR